MSFIFLCGMRSASYTTLRYFQKHAPVPSRITIDFRFSFFFSFFLFFFFFFLFFFFFIFVLYTNIGPEKGRTEVACQSNSGSAFTTGGGFSNLYQAPLWQKEAIEKYFTTVAYELPYVNKSRVQEGDVGFPSPQYNPKGRGYPDISMLGE